MKMKLLAVIAVIMLAGPVWADSIVYEFGGRGSLSITGNSVCGGPCTENIAFTIGINLIFPDGLEADPSGTVTSASGPLGSTFTVSPWFDFGGNPPSISLKDFPFDLEFVDVNGDIIFLAGYIPLNAEGSIQTPVLAGAFFWDCATTTCDNEFVPPGTPPTFTVPVTGYRGFDLLGTVQGDITNVPEPSSLTLLMITITAIGIMLVVKSNRQTV